MPANKCPKNLSGSTYVLLQLQRLKLPEKSENFLYAFKIIENNSFWGDFEQGLASLNDQITHENLVLLQYGSTPKGKMGYEQPFTKEINKIK